MNKYEQRYFDRAKKLLPKRIKIIQCSAFGKAFDNIETGTEHNVINPPKNYYHDERGVWVMGNGEPVKILHSEFRPIDEPIDGDETDMADYQRKLAIRER